MSHSKLYVVDATVAVKWFLKDENDSLIADMLLAEFLSRHIVLHAPSIFRHEVAGALKKAASSRRSGGRDWRIGFAEALNCVNFVYRLPVHIHADEADAAMSAFEMAVQYSKGHYDMLYLNLARKLNCQLITADTKILEGIPPDFPRSNVCLLANWMM